jgi:hypothetical protein
MDRQLFDLLKTPQQLNWLEAALIRDGIQEVHEFEEAFGVSVENAERILFAWEAAQSSEWNRELLCQFIDPEIFPDRRIVQLRVEAAMPERFTPTAGLHWLKDERIPVGDLDDWVRHNTATPAPVAVVSSVAPPKQRAQESRILELLTAQGYVPMRLSQRTPGKPGPKAEIRTLALTEPALFSAKSFEKAWERLRNEGAVAGAE